VERGLLDWSILNAWGVVSKGSEVKIKGKRKEINSLFSFFV